MVVNVNETRSENEPLGIQGCFAGFRDQFADCNDTVARDPHVRAVERRTSAIRDLCVQNHERLRCCLGIGGKECQTAEKQLREKGFGDLLKHSLDKSFVVLWSIRCPKNDNTPEIFSTRKQMTGN